MLDELFPKYHRRYAASPFGPQLERFAQWLASKGYGHIPARNHVRRLKQVLEASSARLPAAFERGDLERLFAAHADAELFRATRRAFERCLADHGLLHHVAAAGPYARVLTAYQEHLVEVRGLSASTVAQHVSTVRAFLEEALPAGAPLSELRANLIERHVVDKGKRVSRQSMQHCVAHLRSFLRFCHSQGLLDRRLDAIDTPRVYRDELPPRALPWAVVQQLLRSVDRRDAMGWRDYAILHLMAHYGLRPSEVVALRLDSIDWQANILRVEQRKTRSALLLPLTEPSVRILRRYLREGRPGSNRPELFLRARGPAGTIKHTAVCDIYRSRAARSGLPIDRTSSYSLRHSFAMRLLERGVGIKAIGDVLGHRSLESTCVYLRLHTDALRDVALPLPTAAATGAV